MRRGCFTFLWGFESFNIHIYIYIYIHIYISVTPLRLHLPDVRIETAVCHNFFHIMDPTVPTHFKQRLDPCAEVRKSAGFELFHQGLLSFFQAILSESVRHYSYIQTIITSLIYMKAHFFPSPFECGHLKQLWTLKQSVDLLYNLTHFSSTTMPLDFSVPSLLFQNESTVWSNHRLIAVKYWWKSPLMCSVSILKGTFQQLSVAPP